MKANGAAVITADRTPIETIPPPADRAVDIGPVDAIAPGQGRVFLVAGRTIAVFHQRDGRVFATDNRCPHRGGPLADGIVGDGTVICPLHSWRIDLGSGHCAKEAACVRTYAARVVNGRVLLGVGGGA